MPLPGYDEVGGESFHFIDVNADGLDDWMKCTKSKCGVALNKGNGTFMSFEWLIAAAQAAMYIGDFDGDASNDILFYNALYSSITHGVSHHPYINTFTDSNGNQHQVEYAKLTDPEVYTRDAYNAGLSFAKSRPYQQPLTVVKSLTTPNHQVYYKYAGARMDNGKYGYLGFKSITSVLAKEDEAGAPQSLVTVSYLNQDYPLVGKLQTVKKKVYPGTADKLVGDISYAYDGEHDYLVAMLDGSPVGAATTSALADNIQARGDVATGTDFSGQMNSYFDWQYLSLTGGVYKTFLAEKVVDHLQLSNDALIKTERTEAVWTKATSNYARLLETTSGVYDAAGKLVQEQQTAITYEYTDSYGLPSSFLVDDSTVTTTLYSNGNPIGNHSVAMEYDYFGNGLVQYQWLNRNDAKGTRSSYQYDGYGNVTDMTVEAVNAAASRSESERSTTKTYTNQGKYLYSEANSLGHTTTYESYTVHGLPQRTTDPKGLVTTFTYDGLGRLATTTDYLNNTHRTLRGFCSVTNTGCTNGAYVWEKQEPAGSAQSYTWWDKKGQVVKTATQSLQSSAWVVQAWVYDPYGREAKASVPKLLSLSSSVSFSASSDRAYTEQTYDELNRVVRKQLPGVNRVVTKDYRDQLDVVTIDPAGRRTATITNALGQTTRKEQPDNTAILFTYNAQGLVTKQQYPKLSTSGSILSGQYNQIVNGYDNYGNQISLSDPNQGTWTYQYNAFGELIQQTDARGKSTLFSYDELGRMVSQRDDETYSVWTYDTEELGLLDVVSQYRISSLSASAKAALTPANVAATSGVTLAWQQATDYDDSSMLPTWQQTKQRNRSGQVLTSIATTDYDGYGRVQYSQLPSLYQNKGSLSAPRLAYSYSSSGYLSQIKDRDSSTVYQKVDSIDAFDNITAQTLSGGVELYRSYNANTGWANDLQAVNSSGLIIDQSYGSYNKLGHIGSRDDATYYSNGSYQTWSDSFSYADRLKQQLTGVTTQYSQNINGISLNQNWSHSYSYDALGNIRTKATTAMEGGSAGNAGSSYQYQYNNTARPHQLSATTGSVSHSYSYDANGNTTNDGSKTFTYNAWNKVNTITKGSNNTRFEYGPDRTRYLRVDVEGGTTTETLYVGDGYERVTTGSTVQHKYTLHGIALVIQTEGANTEATQGMISDYQDSLLAITDHNGNLQQRFRYTPFGEQVEVSAGVTGAKSFTTHGYTSHEHIEGMDVIHMGGRIYDPVIGRMLQSDPIVQAPQNILSYNRYSYVWNNPMNRVDPTGYTSNSSSGPGGENTEDQAQGNATSSAEDANTNGKDPFAGLSDAELEALIAKSCTCVSFDERGIQTITIYGNWSDLPALEDGDTDDSGSGQPGFGDDEAGGLGGGAGRGEASGRCGQHQPTPRLTA
jgi:RHS repeat-associated protein